MNGFALVFFDTGGYLDRVMEMTSYPGVGLSLLTDFVGLTLYMFFALLGNALICGALSSPFDRYQNRLIWLATLVVGMAGAAWWHRFPSTRVDLARIFDYSINDVAPVI